ncbi:CDP-glucose 4,6-dehydratase [Croceicoccus pelagius]|uniref:CDP-glucose 4,6-dehydratase n=1 Tax=Croceicoccus pelagius TaxID=1703341 RepID=A0A916YLU4_9SPHN|nr:CDP-glucose 4,6-dehydratase [Croceicoccus pelagius]GGD50557.1 CDP-glucose 4,6-dehydratase [Croceicoccus pelagius]
MENLVNPDFWEGRRVFLTGHTGFKGSWLALWLVEMGAEVTGFALPAEDVSLFNQAGIANLVTHIEGDIRDLDAVDAAMAACDPQVVFHLAAQPIVRTSYDDPVGTYATNVQGTVHVLDACRRAASLDAIVCVTSDKCYENREWIWPYRESDPMGGHDPYSSSKGAAEIAIASYRRSFFEGEGAPLLASVRAGNVIGGGDWAVDRLIPDIVRAMVAGERVQIRSPHAVRPWQHVLEALGGYLLIAQRLAKGERDYADGWNFGPADSDTQPVGWIVEKMINEWGEGGFDLDDGPKPHEANLLRLDCSKARAKLGWQPALGLAETIRWIVAWHRSVADGGDARAITSEQLTQYRARMERALQGA